MSTAGDSQAHMDVIDSEECFGLLAGHEIGRLGVTVDHYPLIIPLNYRLDGQTLVLRTHPGPILAAAEHANVTFEVDEIDRRARSGWSVLVRGLAEQGGPEHRDELIARTHATQVTPWAPGEHGAWLRLIVHHISGRRIVPGQLPWGVDPRAYL